MSDSDQNTGRRRKPPPSDAELLEVFSTSRDAQAFRELVVRHERLVLGVCRRILWDAHDAQDAFQATFMILAAKAREVRSRTNIGGWLYAVAHRTAVRARARRQRRRELPLTSDFAAPGDALAEMARRDQMQRFDEELNRLPEKYRDPLVLHHLAGRTQNEVAQELGLTVRTVEGRLRRAKKELRYRLAKRGVGLATVVAVVQGEASATGVAGQLVEATVASSVNYASGGAGAAGSDTAQYLVRKELSTMATSSLSMPAAAIAVIASAVILATAGDLSQRHSAAAESGRIDLAGAIEKDELADAGNAPVTAFEAAEPMRPPEGRENGAGAIDYRSISNEERKIYGALQQPTQIDFVEVPLAEVVEFIARTNEIRVFIDQVGLARENLKRDTLIDFQSQGIPLKHALERIVDPLHLDYVVTSEYLLITSEERAKSMMETRVYNVRGVSKRLTTQALAEIVKDTIRPDTWNDESLSTAIATLPDGLVVTHCQRAHEEIAGLIRQLERHAAADESQ